MATCRFLFPNRIDGATLSGGSWLSALPLVNLQDRILQKVARSTNALPASTQFSIDLGRSRDINAVVLINHNLSTTATYRVQASDVADFSTLLYNEGGLDTFAFPPISSTLLLSWADENWWSGLPATEDLAGITLNSILVLDATVRARYWRVLIFDTFNDDGYVQIGRVFLSGQWQPPYNYGYGAQAGFVDPSTAERSLGGNLFFDRRRVYRTANFGFGYLPEAETFARVFDLVRIAGTTAEIFWIPDADDTLNLQRRSFLARLREMSTLEQAVFQGLSVQFALEELI